VLRVRALSVSKLSRFHKNPRRGDVSAIAESLAATGQYKPIVVNEGTLTGRPFEVLAGNHTLDAAVSLGWSRVEVATVDVDDAVAARIVLADNRTADLGGYDDDLLAELLGGLDDLVGTGYSDADLRALLAEPAGAGLDRLVDRFGAAPLSVLSARGGDWQARKRVWSALGLSSTDGRDEQLVFDSPQTRFLNWYDVKNAAEAAAGHKLTDAEVLRDHAGELRAGGNGTSEFDPVLTELLYSWFSAPGARIIDPWAGGSVRGVVAAVLGREYVGVELRPEQIEANREQLRVIDAAVRAGVAGSGGTVPEWVAAGGLAALADESFDLAFSAPPRPGEGAHDEDGAVEVEVAGAPEVPLVKSPRSLTPVEEHGGVLVKRDDLYGVGKSRGGKVRSCWALAEAAKKAGKRVLVTAGSRQSPQVNIVAEVAAALGMRAEVHVPSGGLTPELLAAQEAGADVVQHAYGRELGHHRSGSPVGGVKPGCGGGSVRDGDGAGGVVDGAPGQERAGGR
jgi:hypothetical protein